jgi:RNA recognition motif-containing protein
MEKRIYVGNLSYNTTEGDVQDLFQQAGTVVSCHLMLDKFTSRSRGFAFVEMETVDEANKAVEMFNEQDFQGRSLRVNIARPREERPSRPREDRPSRSREDRPPRRDGGGYRDRGDRNRY